MCPKALQAAALQHLATALGRFCWEHEYLHKHLGTSVNTSVHPSKPVALNQRMTFSKSPSACVVMLLIHAGDLSRTISTWLSGSGLAKPS